MMGAGVEGLARPRLKSKAPAATKRMNRFMHRLRAGGIASLYCRHQIEMLPISEKKEGRHQALGQDEGRLRSRGRQGVQRRELGDQDEDVQGEGENRA